MSFANKYNTVVNPFTFQSDSTFEFKTLEELYTGYGKDEIYTLRGVWINPKGKYGPAPVATTDEFFVNLPGHLLETVHQFLEDEATINDINAGKCGFKVHTYHQDTYDKDCYGVTWVDIKDEGFKQM